MNKVWAVSRHTIAAGIRMKVAVFFVTLIVLSVLVLPFVLKGDGSLAGAIQSYLTYSVMLLGVLLSLQTIFMSWTLSDELVQHQILVLMAKPVARWQYILGKWLGIVLLDLAVLIGAGWGVYGMTRHMASLPEWIEGDHLKIQSEILVARHVSPVQVRDFKPEAAREFERRKEEGRYVDRVGVMPAAEKDRLRQELETRWRAVLPQEGREFKFENLQGCRRSPEERLQLRFNATVNNPPPNDVITCIWRFGDRRAGTAEYAVMRRYVRGRIHSINVPTDSVAANGTLTVRFENVDPFGENIQRGCIFQFEPHKTLEVLYTVGTFGGNLVRALALVFCRLLFLAAVAVLATTLLSFPIACLFTLTCYVIVALRGFILGALEYMTDPEFSLGDFSLAGLLEWVLYWLNKLMIQFCYLVLPNWQAYDGLEMLADGRNVTLAWVVVAWAELGLVALVLVGLACLIFERREVSEVSV